jgi:hypothetical protein
MASALTPLFLQAVAVLARAPMPMLMQGAERAMAFLVEGLLALLVLGCAWAAAIACGVLVGSLKPRSLALVLLCPALAVLNGLAALVSFAVAFEESLPAAWTEILVSGNALGLMMVGFLKHYALPAGLLSLALGVLVARAAVSSIRLWRRGSERER